MDQMQETGGRSDKKMSRLRIPMCPSFDKPTIPLSSYVNKDRLYAIDDGATGQGKRKRITQMRRPSIQIAAYDLATFAESTRPAKPK
jgi:hypothetical protein